MKKLISTFARSESGTTIEFVLWLPVFVIILSLIADTSLIFFGQSRVYRVIQVANRAYSLGQLETESSLETYITNAVASIGATATVQSELNNGIIHTMVQVPARDFEALGLITVFSNLNLTMSSDLVKEVM
ncbi:MAG: TadE/TadG family type IV pilus assembly protein [Maritimibacter sp.]